MSANQRPQEPTIDSEETIATTKWLTLKTLNYTDAEGVKRKWDIATRTTHTGTGKPDAVVIIPILKSSKSKILDTILVSQFRPPMAQKTLEFPAGLVDKGERPEETAVRELLEETGYFGTVYEGFQSMLLCMTPGLTNETIKVIVINVDLDDSRNKNPKQMLDDGEDISLKRVPLMDGLRSAIGDEENGMPIAMLYTFAMGLEMGLEYGKKSTA
jgi:ADP-ribose pyrophosphatase